ncbi:MAG TPA: hypothetical protein ACFCUY_12335 [Xenococcaceae cyanobacterium]
MTSNKQLEGIELIDCAKSNAKEGTEIAAKQCGYGQNLELFTEKLIQACQEIGVDINELSDLITEQQIAKRRRKSIEIAPETKSDL